MLSWDSRYFVEHCNGNSKLFIYFQAHNAFEACLKGNEVLKNTSQEVGDTWVISDLGLNVSLSHCDLQEQLDKSASGTGLAFILFTGNEHT